jgi:MFS family permease
MGSRSKPRLTPQRPHVPPSVRRPFIVAALAVTSAYSIGGLFFALGPELSGRVFGTGNHLVAGLSLFLLAGVGSLAQLAYGRRVAWLGATAGSVALAFGAALIVLAAAEKSAAALIIGSIVGGAGFGLAFLGALRALSAPIPPTHRAGVMSAFLVAAYAALSIPAVLAGFAARPLGLESTFEILGSAVAVLALVVAGQAWRARPRPETWSAKPVRPGDLQPADRLLHIAHASGERAPNRYLCGAPVRQLIARIQPGTGPRGAGVCATCAQLDAARAGGRERPNRDHEE